MARFKSCDRCKFQKPEGLCSEWDTIDFGGYWDICPNCSAELKQFLASIEKPTMVTSEYCDATRHMFTSDSHTCQCGRFKIDFELINPAPFPDLDKDIPF